MSVETTEHRGGAGTQMWAAPPSVDVPGHLRDLRRAALPAVGVGLLVFLLVFGLQTLLSPKLYEGTALGQITTTDVVVGGDAYTEQLRAPFVALASDETVQDIVLAQFDSGLDREALAANTTLGPGAAPTILSVTVRANSPEQAGQLARATLVALDQAAIGQRAREMENQVAEVQSAIAAARIRATEIADDNLEKSIVDAEIDAMVDQLGRLQVTGGSRLLLLAQPEASSSPVSPQPISTGLVAALVAAIVAAEAIVFYRARMGVTPTEPWARRLARRTRAGYEPSADGLSGLTARAAMMLNVKAGAQTLVLVGTPAQVDVAIALPAGADLSWITVSGLDTDWWREVDLARLSGAAVVTSVHATSRGAAERALARLAELGVRVELVLQDGAADAAAEAGQL